LTTAEPGETGQERITTEEMEGEITKTTRNYDEDEEDERTDGGEKGEFKAVEERNGGSNAIVIAVAVGIFLCSFILVAVGLVLFYARKRRMERSPRRQKRENDAEVKGREGFDDDGKMMEEISQEESLSPRSIEEEKMKSLRRKRGG